LFLIFVEMEAIVDNGELEVLDRFLVCFWWSGGGDNTISRVLVRHFSSRQAGLLGLASGGPKRDCCGLRLDRTMRTLESLFVSAEERPEISGFDNWLQVQEPTDRTNPSIWISAVTVKYYWC
jgi:hypothetical protein